MARVVRGRGKCWQRFDSSLIVLPSRDGPLPPSVLSRVEKLSLNSPGKSTGRAFSADTKERERERERGWRFAVNVGNCDVWLKWRMEEDRIEVAGSLKSDRVREAGKGQRAASLVEFVRIVRGKFVVALTR